MKTVFINCSPKKRFSASEYLLFLQRVLVGGKQAVETLRAPADHAHILEQLRDAQAVVFCLPLYVDGVPSHVLRFLEEMEAFCGRNALRLSLYCVANNGYIAWISFGENIALMLFFNLGVLFYLARMARFIRKRAFGGKRYTRILVPSFIFILFADIFFVLASLFEGGLFQGWLAKKEFEES